ncbi:MAG: XRE family transcriptional regulator [Thermodesulfobacteriota bacterium]|nr:XRE family transcriptional regulator [Thermodesulfobacteriota bacterium]
MKQVRFVGKSLEDIKAFSEAARQRAGYQLLHEYSDKAAQIMGVSRPRVSDAIRGKIDNFTIDSLVDMLTKAGRHVKVTVLEAA